VNLSPVELAQLQDLDIIELANKIRKVRTPEGAKKYGVPIGTVITKDMEDKLQGKSGSGAPASTIQSGANNFGSNSGSSATPKGAAPAPANSLNAQGQTKNSRPKVEKEQQQLKGQGGQPAGSSAAQQTAVADAVQANLTVTDSTISGPLKFSVGSAQYSAPSGSVLIKSKKGTGGGAYVRTPDGTIHAFNQEGEITLPDNLGDILSLKFTKNFKSDAKYAKAEFDNDDTETFPELAAGAVLQSDGQDMFTKGEDGFWTHKDIDISLTDEDLAPMFESGELTLKETPVGFNEAGKADFKNMSKDEFKDYLYSKKEGDKLYLNGTEVVFNGESWLSENGADFSEDEMVVFRSKVTEEPNTEEAGAPSATPEANKNTLKVGDLVSTPEEEKNLPVGAVMDVRLGGGKKKTPHTKTSEGKWTEPGGSAVETLGYNLSMGHVTVKSLPEDSNSSAPDPTTAVDLPAPGSPLAEETKVKSLDNIAGYPVGTKLQFTLPSVGGSEGFSDTYTKIGDNQWASADPTFKDTPVSDSSFKSAIDQGLLTEVSVPEAPDPDYTLTPQDLMEMKDGDGIDVGGEFYVKSNGVWLDSSGSDNDDEAFAEDLEEGNVEKINDVLAAEALEIALEAKAQFEENERQIKKQQQAEKKAAEEEYQTQAQLQANIEKQQAEAAAKKKADQEKAAADAAKAAAEAEVAAQAAKTAKYQQDLAKANAEQPKVGKILVTVEEMDSLSTGTKVKYTSIAGASTEYVHQSDGSWLSDSGTVAYTNSFYAAVNTDLVSISALPDTSPAPEPQKSGDDGTFLIGGKPYSAKEVKRLHAVLSMHHGPVSLGMKILPDSPFADKNAMDELKALALADFPKLGIKPGIVAYLKNIMDNQKSEKSVPTPSSDGDFQVNGKVFSSDDFQEALTSLEDHPGFQISYGLKAVPNNPFVDKDNQGALKQLAQDAFPNLKPKPAVVAYLKKQLGYQDEEESAQESEGASTGTSIYFGSRTPKSGVQGVDGGEFDQADVESAIAILQNYPGKLYKNELNKQGNPLGALDPNAIVGFHKDKLEGKAAYIKLLQTKLDKSKTKTPMVAPEVPDVNADWVDPNAPEENKNLVPPGGFKDLAVGSEVSLNFPASPEMDPQPYLKVSDNEWKNTLYNTVHSEDDLVVAQEYANGSEFSITKVGAPAAPEKIGTVDDPMSVEDVKNQGIGAQVQTVSKSGKTITFTKVSEVSWDGDNPDYLDMDSAAIEILAKKNQVQLIKPAEESSGEKSDEEKATDLKAELFAYPAGTKAKLNLLSETVTKQEDGSWKSDKGTTYPEGALENGWDGLGGEFISSPTPEPSQASKDTGKALELDGYPVGHKVFSQFGDITLTKESDDSWKHSDGTMLTSFQLAGLWDAYQFEHIGSDTASPNEKPLAEDINFWTSSIDYSSDWMELEGTIDELPVGTILKNELGSSMQKKSEFEWVFEGGTPTNIAHNSTTIAQDWEVDPWTVEKVGDGLYVEPLPKNNVTDFFASLQGLNTPNAATATPETPAAKKPTEFGEPMTADDFLTQPVGSVMQLADDSGFYTKAINGTWEDLDDGHVLTTANVATLVSNEGALLFEVGKPDVPDYAAAPGAVQSKQTGDPDTSPNINESGLTPGKYSTENGKAYMVVSANGSGVYVTSKGEVTAINAAKVKANHKAGMTTYGGVVENPPVPSSESTVEATKKKVVNDVIPSGTYYNGPSNDPKSTVYIVDGDAVKIYKNGAEPKVGKQSSIQSVFKKGQLLDQQGNSIFPKDYTGSVSLLGQETTIPALILAQKAIDNHTGSAFDSKLQYSIKQAGVFYEGQVDLETFKANIDSMLKDVDKSDPDTGAANLFEWDGLGNATFPESMVGVNKGYKISEYNAFIKQASLSIGGGNIIGQHTNAMSKTQKGQWINAFNNGDFKAMYQIEVAAAASKNLPHAAGYLHPGYEGSPSTNKVQWGAAVPGEIPAGVKVDKFKLPETLSWSNPNEIPKEVVDNYLVAAQMQNPEYLTLAERRQWATSHYNASIAYNPASPTNTVNKLSLQAQSLKASGAAPLTDSPKWTEIETMEKPKLYVNLFEQSKFPTEGWTATAAEQWYEDNKAELDDYVTNNSTAKEQGITTKSLSLNKYVTQQYVKMYFEDKESAAAAEALIPVYTKDPTQTVKGSTNPVHQYTDQFGNKYFFKPRADTKLDKYRSEVEHMGNEMSRALGFNASKSSLQTLNGQYGQLQSDAGGVGDLMNADYSKQSLTTLKDVAAEHILDWFLDNDDTKGDNVRVMANGHVVGIDKGRAFKSYGAWKGLSGDAAMNSNANTVYSQMYAAIKSGKISKADADEIYKATHARALKMQKFSDARLDALLDQGMANRTSYDVPYKLSDGTYASDSLDGLKMAVKDRRDRLAEDFDSMWSKIYQQAGYGDLPEPEVSPLGDVISGLGHEKLHTEVFEANTHGKSTLINSSSVVGGTVHLWVEKNKKADKLQVKGEMYVGDLKQQELLGFFSKHTEGLSDEKMQSGFNSDEFGEGIVNAAKTINHHALDQKYNMSTVNNFFGIEKNIDKDLDAWTPNLEANSTFMNEPAYKFPSGTLVPMVHVDQYKLMLDYYKPKAASVSAAYDSQGKVAIIEPYSPLSLPVKDMEEQYGKTDGSSLVKLSNNSFLYKDSANSSVSTVSEKEAMALMDNGADPGWSSVSAPKVVTPNLPYTVKLNEKTHEKVAAYDSRLNLKVEMEASVGQNGARGKEFEITLDTGEKIYWRNAGQTGTAMGQHGKLTFVMPDAGDSQSSQASMARIQNVLSDLGIDNEPADDTTARNIYWREMYGVMMNRKHKPNSPNERAQKAIQAKIAEIKSTERKFIEEFGRLVSPEEENEFWTKVYSDEWPKEVANLLQTEGYLPKYDHLNIQNSELESGKPYWDRFDVSDDEYEDAVLYHESSSTTETIIESGGLFSGEERVRQLGFIATPSGLYGSTSPLQDQSNGSSHVIYTRVRKVGTAVPSNVPYVVDPKLMKRTRMYALPTDLYGILSARKGKSLSGVKDVVEEFNGNSKNEVMPPNAVSVLDGMMVILFDNAAERNAMIQRLKELSIEQIRGVPVEDRLVMRVDAQKAIKKIKESGN
jgi:vacuolar-type H+-ATPase subunit E/Vma4